MSRTPPGPGMVRLGLELPNIAKNPLDFLLRMLARHGDFVSLNGGLRRYYVVRHPDAIRHVLLTNQKNYGKMTALETMMGEGLSVSEGAAWQQQRRRIQSAFDHSSLDAISRTVTDAAREMSERWESNAEQGQAVCVSKEMIRLALDVVGRAMFGTRLHAYAGELEESLNYLQKHLQQGFLIPDWLLPWRRRRFEHAVATIDRIVRHVIDERRPGVEHHDLLSMLLSNDGEPMSPRMIRDNVMVMLLGGYETTATALTWTWYLLSRHPEIEQRLQAELETVFNGAPPAFADVPKLRFTRMILEETMRLYPPAWVIPRRVKEDDEIGGYRVRAGATLLLAVYATHRDPAFWEDPQVFAPDRFSPEQSAARPAHAYIPFGGGARKCPGYAFAMLEMTLILAATAQRYHVEVIDNGAVVPEPLLVLRPKQNIFANLRRKAPAARETN